MPAPDPARSALPPSANSRTTISKSAAETAPSVGGNTGAHEVKELSEPRDGVPAVIQTKTALAECITRFAEATGPLAIDAERASGHRYGQRAFLVQLRRAGAGTALIDTDALQDLSALSDALQDTEWILHAASQDLPCLMELGMHPARLFDTELGGRLAGFPKVGLGTLTEELLGLRLAKEHSAVDWSTRPLPEPWLRYAALDVEVLDELRDAIAQELEKQGKLDWAHQEFAALAAAPAASPRVDPWRRTSGLHKVRDRRKLLAVKLLWETRDRLGRSQDVAPGRVIPDSAIVAAALDMPQNGRDLCDIAGFVGRGSRRHLADWVHALQEASQSPAEALPPTHVKAEGPPPARLWNEKNPEAGARLGRVRLAVNELAEDLGLPAENLISPYMVRRIMWEPPAPATAEAVQQALAEMGARPWQIECVTDVLVEAIHPTT